MAFYFKPISASCGARHWTDKPRWDSWLGILRAPWSSPSILGDRKAGQISLAKSEKWSASRKSRRHNIV